ncbi:hypothetical protein [Neptunicella marina]|uniref:Uncharacterized protein n=1 Tax=Neptunicella marina TaxID=2125989 RepID=A0A8J6IS56_9ALTE|nr:hypothetical protein [Neptunicella marina]MBC3766465.1 hypothetical protein [Neptunicella marina]
MKWEFCLSISQFGLIVDIVGVAVLAFFNTPSEVMNKEGLHYQTVNLGEKDSRTIAEKRKYRFHRGLTYVGYVLLLIGFLLQFIGSFTH